ncbi:MAG: hypothetical protein ACRECX_09205 [Methyloceanibacter sp.]|uniref:hypothetical protein n=1 Tax=Methyloceanibacter sp. TaxID=1965321 RepID=UPI003D6C9B72
MTKSALCFGLALLGALACSPAYGQSEFLSERFPYDAFDRLKTTPIHAGGSTLNVGFAPGASALPRSAILAWLETSAKAVSVYFGKFPVASARILIVPVPDAGVPAATTFGYRGAAIRFVVGSDVTKTQLADDWKGVHEMTHLALPYVDETHLWLAEGVAVYVEPVARVQAGDLTAERIWGDMVRDMKQGLPQKGDRGLDFTPTWGRTYWGGAMFYFLADIEIRKATGNRAGLQQALRGILAAGGDHEQHWPIERVLSTADEATGTTVLSDLYAKMGDKPYAPDLDALWRDLGISVRAGKVTFDDSAPLAPIRRAITAAPSPG